MYLSSTLCLACTPCPRVPHASLSYLSYISPVLLKSLTSLIRFIHLSFIHRLLRTRLLYLWGLQCRRYQVRPYLSTVYTDVQRNVDSFLHLIKAVAKAGMRKEVARLKADMTASDIAPDERFAGIA